MTIIDPIIRGIELQKLSHNFAVGDRVRVRESGHRGKITDIDQFSRHHVLLDSHHSVQCSASEIEPEDFPANETAAPMAPLDRAYDFGDRVAKAVVDPIQRDDIYGFVKHTEAREGSEILAKRARSPFHIGQAVKAGGRSGTVLDVTPGGLIEVRYGPGLSGLSIPSDVQAA